MSMCHNTLEVHMRQNYLIASQMNSGLADIDNLLPWERTAYFYMILEKLEKEKEEIEKTRRK